MPAWQQQRAETLQAVALNSDLLLQHLHGLPTCVPCQQSATLILSVEQLLCAGEEHVQMDGCCSPNREDL